jgi:hypothetical protein
MKGNSLRMTIGALLLSAAAAAPAFAMPPGGFTTFPAGHMGQPQALGQPNQSCGSANAPNRPGNAQFAPGSAFNPSGHAGTQYAGQKPQNSRNPASVAQYDVACFNQTK